MKPEIEQLYKIFKTGAEICTDTRNIIPGCIFFALKGENFNGNKFALQAIEKGAAVAVIDESVESKSDQLIKVNDVLETLQSLAQHHRLQLKIPFLGITGSNGKTTTKELVSRVLSKKFKTHYTKGNLNNHIGVPLTLLSISSSDEFAVIEMGANHQKEIELLCSIAMPGYVLITNVGLAHLDGFGGFEGVKKGKGEMYEFARNNNSVVFINKNSDDLKSMLGSSNTNTFSYGDASDCNVIGKLYEGSRHVSLMWKIKNNDTEYKINSSITGSYNYENILAAIAVGVYFKVTPDLINEAIANYIPDNQRSQEIITDNNHIILDAYNANPTSMQAVLKNFEASFNGNRAVFLGDMLELGENTIDEHRKILNLIRDFKFDLVVLVGDHFKTAGSADDGLFFKDSDEAKKYVSAMDLKKFNVLIKGSRGSKMEKMLDCLQTTGK